MGRSASLTRVTYRTQGNYIQFMFLTIVFVVMIADRLVTTVRTSKSRRRRNLTQGYGSRYCVPRSNPLWVSLPMSVLLFAVLLLAAFCGTVLLLATRFGSFAFAAATVLSLHSLVFLRYSIASECFLAVRVIALVLQFAGLAIALISVFRRLGFVEFSEGFLYLTSDARFHLALLLSKVALRVTQLQKCQLAQLVQPHRATRDNKIAFLRSNQLHKLAWGL